MLVPLTLAIVVGLFYISGAQAVHDLDFELEGNIEDNPAGVPWDWSSFFNSSGSPSPVLPSGTRPGFKSSGFHEDFSRNANGSYNTSDPTTFATGSKDTLSISPGWQCNRYNNVNDKIDLTNAYAVTYVAPATIPGVVDAGDEILYFALERFSNDGDANVAFWFLQGNVTCESPGGATPFVGDHQDGDLLVVSAFTKGGVVSGIDVYRWNGTDNGGSLGTTPVAHGVDCKSTTGGDATCATVNGPSQSPLDPPWDTENKDGGGNLRTAEFFEGGLNLTEKGLGGKCFNTFLANTRSSQELGATLFDFASGKLGSCGLTMTTTPSQTTRVIGSQVAITDTATVSGTTAGGGAGPTPTGTVSFFLCSPAQLTPANTGTCQGTSGTAVTGNPVTVSESVPGTATATSGDAKSLITGLGKYCFRATFTAAANDPNYAGQTAETSNLANECFTVTGTSSLSTAQNWLPTDTATITGDANLSGTVTFTLYTGDNCGATSGSAVTGQQYVVPVSGTSPQTATTSNTTFKVTAANEGSYSWKVHYDDAVLADPADKCEKTTGIDITD